MAHSRGFREYTCAKAAARRGLQIVRDAGHVDLQDPVDLILQNRLRSILKQHLA